MPGRSESRVPDRIMIVIQLALFGDLPFERLAGCPMLFSFCRQALRHFVCALP